MNQKNYLKLIKIITLIIGITSVAWFGFSLLNKYQQIKQFKQANNLLAAKKYDLAIQAYDHLLTKDLAKDHLIWINRGYAFLGLNQYQEMLQSCSTASLIEPDAALAWNCQGEALYYLEQNASALKAFDQAIELNTHEATFWLNKARVFAALQQYQQAIIATEQAIKVIRPAAKYKQAIAFNQKGQYLLKLKQYQQSLIAFETSLNYLPDYLLAQQGAGIALYELGNYPAAISIFNDILLRQDLTDEQKVISLLYMGVSLCQIPKISDAEQVFAAVLALTTDAQSLEIAQKGCGIQ